MAQFYQTEFTKWGIRPSKQTYLLLLSISKEFVDEQAAVEWYEDYCRSDVRVDVRADNIVRHLFLATVGLKKFTDFHQDNSDLTLPVHFTADSPPQKNFYYDLIPSFHRGLTEEDDPSEQDGDEGEDSQD